MKKLIFLMIGILLIGSLFVVAEEEDIKEVSYSNVDYSKVAEPISWWESIFGRAGFEYININDYKTITPYRSTELFKDKSNKDVSYGGNCRVGEYIVLVQCYDKAGTNCIPIFRDSYKKESTTDLLRLSQVCTSDSDSITNCNSRDWFITYVYPTYVGYNCMVKKTSCVYGPTVFDNYNTICSSSGVGVYKCQSGSISYIPNKCDCIAYEVNPECEERYDCYNGQCVVTEGGAYTSPNCNEACIERCSCYVCKESGSCVKQTFTGSECPCDDECSSDTDCVGVEEYTCKICENNKCVEKTFNKPCSEIGKTLCTSDSQCEITTDLTPTIDYVSLIDGVDNWINKKAGDNIKFKIGLKFPNGWKLKEYAESVEATNTEQLLLEVGVYDYNYATKTNWLKDVSWWSRFWAVTLVPESCMQGEKDFVHSYKLNLKQLYLATPHLAECNPDNQYYDEANDACFVTFQDVDTVGQDTLVATLPKSSSKLADGTSNYNSDGHYVIHFGLYHDCFNEQTGKGGYLPNEKSQYNYEVVIGKSISGMACINNLKEICPDGTKITPYKCVEGKFGARTDEECPEENGNGEIKQLSMTKSEWKKATHKEIIQAQCDYDYQCVEVEDHEIDCIYSEEIEARNKKAYEEETGFWGDFMAGLKLDFLGEKKYASGTCRATPISGFAWCSFTEPFAFFEITGDECQDGLIIIIGGIFSLILISKLFGGSK